MIEVTPKNYYDSTLLKHFQPTKLNVAEEISTLFVVGFPENIQEREFQNMFLFSPGFEAATLKVQSKAIDTDLLGENRKQIIGFVKFRTRLEALTAKQVLCGKKIDTEKDCVLKAEIAKKNLHIKKKNEPSRITTTFEAFHSVLPDIPTNEIHSDQLVFDPFYRLERSLSSNLEYTKTSSSRVSTITNLLQQQQQQQQQQKFYFPKKLVLAESQANHHLQHQYFNGNMGNPFTTASPTPSAVFPSKSYPTVFPTPPNSASSSEYLYSPNTCFYQSFSSPSSSGGGGGLEEKNDPQFSSVPSASTSSSSSQPLLTPGVGSPYRNFGLVVGGSTNPADQNPPCNTIYVGNLPTRTNEEELKSLFFNCPGYKRLSFRTKSNGPMCFVEFDNISCATQALQKLHGIPLSNSVKDGIRLSFSKNPLGVRSSSSS